MKCYEICQNSKLACKQQECRYWMAYEEDLNCTLVAVKKHGSLNLREVGKRLSLSFVRIKQIQEEALRKLSKRMQNYN